LNEAAIAGSMVARCSGEAFFSTLNALFAKQNSWAFSTDYRSAIKTVVGALGITPNDVDACLASTDLRSGILSIRSDAAATHGVNATPTFVINGQKVVGALTFAQFSAIIDGL
jgi:protein-disulfide isomerase